MQNQTLAANNKSTTSAFPRRFNPWLGWTVMSLFCIFQFLLQGSVGILSADMKLTFQVEATAISILSSSFFYSYILMQIPAGYIYDRFGIKRVAVTAISVMAVACLFLASSPSFELAIASRILMGLGCSFGFIGLLTGIKQWFPAERFAFISALSECGSMIIVALANTALSQAVMSFGWRVAMFTCAAFAMLLAGLVWRALAASANGPHRDPAQLATPSHEAASPSFWQDFRKLATNRSMWLGGVFAACTFSVVSVFVSLWGVPFLTTVYALDIVEATTVISMVYVGIAVSSPLIGWLASHISCALLMAIGAGLSLLSMLAFLYWPQLPASSLYVLMFSLGFACSVYQLAFALVSRSVPYSVQGTAMGSTNMITMLSAPLLQPIIGIFLSASQGQILDGFEVYTPAAYKNALIVMPICLGLALLVSFSLKEKKALALALEEDSKPLPPLHI